MQNLQLQNLVTQLFESELTKLNYKHMDKLGIIVSDYIIHLHEENIFVEHCLDFVQHITNHIKHRAKVLKEDENITWAD